MSSIKNEILQDLKNALAPLSGQMLAEKYGMTRTGIWKHIQKLVEEGYEIKTVKKKGYALMSMPDRLDEVSITPYLKTNHLGKSFIYLDSTESTQVVGHQIVHEKPHGTTIVAEGQTAGRGRMLREWNSISGKGIWTTIILKPEVMPYQAPQFTLVAAVAVTNAIKSLYPAVPAEIKWPNDILINGKKCTGILTEMIAEADRIHGLLIGIGINANQQLHDFPEELRPIATSLSIETKSHINRAELLAEVLYYLEQYSEDYVKNGFTRIKAIWEKNSATIGKQIKATTLHEIIEGKAVGITESGVLQIELPTGEIKGVYSADIEILPIENK